MIKFFVKRIAVLAGFISVIIFFVDGYNAFAPSAIVLGAVMSVYKLSLWSRMFASRTGSGGGEKKFFAVFIFVLLLTFALMTVFAIINSRLLFGFAAGYLILPLIATVNAFTEGLKITKNNWGEKD